MARIERRQLVILCGVLIGLLIVESMWLAYPLLRDLVIPPEENEVARGRRLAGELGCFTCHGPRGTGSVPNPGSRRDAVPSFHEGTLTMFVNNDQELREYILDGSPAGKRGRPQYRREMARQAIHMPAFRGWVTDDDVDALVAFLRATSDLLAPPGGPAAHGAQLAHENGCFACHGVMGSGGLPNPGSVTGYISGFTGEDFNELVENDEELRAWIADGIIPRFRDDPLASSSLERARIKMPAYQPYLSDEKIDALVAYVRWLAGGLWRDQALVD